MIAPILQVRTMEVGGETGPRSVWSCPCLSRSPLWKLGLQNPQRQVL